MNEVIDKMTDKARERLIATYRGGIEGWTADEFRDSMQAALRAALEAADFSTSDWTYSYRRAVATQKLLRAAYGETDDNDGGNLGRDE